MLIPRDIKNNPVLMTLLPFILAGAYYFIIKAFEIGELIITMSISQASVFLTLIMGYIFLHERSQLRRRSISSVLAVAGAVLVSL